MLCGVWYKGVVEAERGGASLFWAAGGPSRMVHTAIVECSGLTHEILLGYRGRWLTAGEIETARGFVQERSALLYLAGRVLVRFCVAGVLGRELGPQEFRVNAHGKPVFAPPLPPDWDFSITHSWPFTLLALRRDGPVGIDMEYGGPPGAPLPRATRLLSDVERAALVRSPVSQQRDAFFRIWTLKEAITKSLGVGLSLPLSSFTVETESSPIGVNGV